MTATQSQILIVDDQQAMRDTFQLVLSDQNTTLNFAENGAIAIEKAVQIIPDLILLDVMMPDMDGFEVCAHLREHPQLAEVPIIMITALNDTRSRIRGLEVGADEFLSKPFDVSELRARIKTITRLNRYRRLVSERTKFEWVVSESKDGYVSLNKEGLITYANPHALFLLGINPEQPYMPDIPLITMLQEQYQCEPEDAWDNWLEPDTPPLYLIKHGENSEFWLQLDSLPLKDNQKEAWMVRLQDITEQMVLRRDMWRFHLAITHKFRTPLVGMLSGLELLHRHAENLSSEDISKLAGTAFASAQRLHGEIDDVIQYLRTPRMSKTAEAFHITDFPKLIAKIGKELKLNKEQFQLKGVNQLKGVPITISPEAIEMLLWEVLENGIKFHPDKKPQFKITLTQVSNDYISVTIKDDGQHLSPEQLAKIWTPYYQSEKSFTGEIKGMGLGLSMVQNIMWGIGGKSKVYNREEKPGLVVDLLFPLFK